MNDSQYSKGELEQTAWYKAQYALMDARLAERVHSAFRVYCAWCVPQRYLGVSINGKPAQPTPEAEVLHLAISHGMCEGCAARARAEYQKA